VVTLRPYRAGDQRGLITAIDAVCAEGMMATARFEPTPAWRHALTDTSCAAHLLLLALADGRVVGWCRLFPADAAQEGGEVELGIGVMRAWRSRGVGRALMGRALEWAVERGCARVTLTTRADNEPAIRLFARSGFDLVPGDGDSLRMAIPLAAFAGRQCE